MHTMAAIIPLNLKGKMNQELLLNINAAILILIFLYTGLSKIFNYHTFHLQLGRHPLLAPFAGFISVIIPVIQITLAILLYFPKSRMSAVKASAILLLIFTLYLLIMI